MGRIKPKTRNDKKSGFSKKPDFWVSGFFPSIFLHRHFLTFEATLGNISSDRKLRCGVTPPIPLVVGA
ncbi:hypothetical protein NJ959_24885 [Symplocastrum sp. BBK-W-15]|uniref:Uncharacterized protein n=1 Tax=Limnofasciculus baicalensis BBK-W-15 TaxID=2699891 RepID=A0AAE3KPS3_9CYAN|nr:hypothetical protein [Limnofasciculus baicalensis BBK-W-15]